MLFTDSTKGLMNLKTSIDSKYNSMKAFNKLLISFKAVKTKKKTETRLKKERIIKNLDELYEKYYNAYRSDYDTDDELNETTRRSLIDAPHPPPPNPPTSPRRLITYYFLENFPPKTFLFHTPRLLNF